MPEQKKLKLEKQPVRVLNNLELLEKMQPKAEPTEMEQLVPTLIRGEKRRQGIKDE